MQRLLKGLRKTVAVMLSLTVLLTIMSITAFADLGVTKENTPAENQGILEDLQELYGDDTSAEQSLQELDRLGLLDGEEWVTRTVDLDGQQLTLEQVRELVFAVDADLSKTVTVEGTVLTLGDLKTMIKIEDEIERIRNTYFSDVTLTEAQQQALASLGEQIENKGISIMAQSSDQPVFPSGIDHGIYAEVSKDFMQVANGNGEQSVTVTLKNHLGEPLLNVPDYDISLGYRFVDGSAKKGTNYNYNEATNEPLELTFSAGSNETSKTIPFSVLNDTNNFEGSKTFLIQFYDPTNVLLAGGKRAAETVVNIKSPYTWADVRELINIELFDGGRLSVPVSSHWLHVFEEEIINKIWLWVDGMGAYYNGPPLVPRVYLGALPESGPLQSSDDCFEYTFARLGDWKWLIVDEQLFYQNGSAEKMLEAYEQGRDNFALFFDEEDIYWWLGDVIFKFVDSVEPQVDSVVIPNNMVFEYGQSVPIVVQYSEPVNLESAKLVVNGETLIAAEAASGGVKQATFLYSVKQIDGTSLHVTDVYGATDIHENNQGTYSLGTKSATGIIKGIQKVDAFTTATASTFLNGTKTAMTGNLTLNLVDDVPDWLTTEADGDTGQVTSICASIDGGNTMIDLFVDDLDDPTALAGSFTEELNTTNETATKVVEFYLKSDENGSGDSNDNEYGVFTYDIVIGKYATYTVEPVVFLEESDFSIAYNSFPTEAPIFAEEDVPLSLGVALRDSVSATWIDPVQDFSWESSNTEVATIDSNGTISLTGAAGSVTFTLTAKNGDIEGKAVSLTSQALEVRAGLIPFLQIPTNSNVLMVRQGDSAQVRWTSNLIAKNAEQGLDTEFNIQMYRADYATGSLQRGELVSNETRIGSVQNPVSSHLIPAGSITQVSALPQHSYIVEVSAVDPVSGQTLAATAYINVLSQPAVVQLQPLDNYYITDSTAIIPVSWTLQHFDMLNDADFKLEIKNNADGSIVYTETITENHGGSYDFVIPPVTNGFRDIYTVAVKAKNRAEPTWSYDSFVLYVYSSAALELWIDGVPVGSEHVMSNVVRIGEMTSAEILALERDIHLKNVISINYGEHAWGQIRDQIEWQSSDNSVASINFRQGSLYENIKNFDYVSYRPATDFVLSGLKDGTTRVSATHAVTGLTQSVDVQVETLKDKLYLFQVYPRAETTFTYINGSGEERSVNTNDDGALALYEEDGINSDIYLQSVFNEREYRGTIYRHNLVSSEKDSTKLELYPQNNFKLREVATVDLYFKQPNGEPYTGDVILRGGVYKNGAYCPEALLNGVTGEADQTITLNASGRFTVQMDATQFWTQSDAEVLQPEDELQFVYEVRFPHDQYYPQLITLNGNLNVDETVRFGLSTVSLRAMIAGEENKPFVDSQHAQLADAVITRDVRTFTGRLGPGQDADRVVLTTRVLWWGETADDGQGLHDLVFEDQFGTVPLAQEVETIVYPFSTMKSSFHTFTLDSRTMQGWLKVLQIRQLNLNVIDGDGHLYRKIPMPFSIVNMLGADKVEVSFSLTFLLQTLTTVSGAEATDLGLSDSLLGAGFNKLMGQNIQGQLFNMTVVPTTDPTVFKAFIQAGLDNMAYDSDDSSELSVTPSAADTADMARGKYFVKQKKELAYNKEHTATNRNRDLHYAFGCYMEAEIVYNFEKQEWEIFVLNGSFNAGGGVSYDWNYNAWVGPVPVTGQFKVGATVETIFKVAIQRGEEIRVAYSRDAVNDYLTTLRLYAYFRAFAGFGFDYTVSALKIGLFGQVSLDAQFAFLNQPYISSQARKGQFKDVNGRVGIEFVAKILFASYKKILASQRFDIYDRAYGEWNSIQDLWKKIGKGSSDASIGSASVAMKMPGGTTLYPVAERSVLEERGYLEQFKRSWAAPSRFSIMSLDSESGLQALETNSYPYSNPVLSNDGQLLVYVSDADSSDVEDTEVRFSILSNGSYPNGLAIETDSAGFGDSQLALAGTKDFAAAAWVRQSEKLSKEAGEEITGADVALMTNSTEIVVGIYDGAQWNITELTNNASPDLAPVVATNGNKVLVAWRSVYATDADNPLCFDGVDRILYSIYENSSWSDAETLYNGTSGSVKGLDAAMLSDGTTAITYAVDSIGSDFVLASNSEAVHSGMEIVYALVDAAGQVTENVRLTNDSYLDQNPQLITTTFADQSEWFVLGWHSVHDVDGVATNDIRLRAFNRAGLLHPGFLDSISSVYNASDVHISPNFRFSENAAVIDDLSLIWAESANTGDVDDEFLGADKDILRAVKFCTEGGGVQTTAALEVAQMPNFTLVDHFDVYLASDDTIRAIILGTNYANGFESTGLTVKEASQLNELLLPARQSNLYTATASYENAIELTLLALDYDSVVRGMQIPMQFRVQNSGTEPISEITIEVGGNANTFNGLYLLPSDSMMLTAYYDIPANRVVNPQYSITAAFDLGEGATETDVLSGTVYLAIPDVGISRLECLREEDGERLMQVTLYNNSDVQLAGSNRVVKLGFYRDADYAQAVMPVQTVDAAADLELLDAGAFTKQMTWDIKDYVGSGNEIPAGGVQLYARAWIEEPLPDDPTKMGEILEYHIGNNEQSMLFESLIERSGGQLAAILTEQVNENGVTKASVTVKNNSLVQVSSGNLVVRLLDENGQELEALQCYDTAAANNGLIELGPEALAVREFTFSQLGAEVAVTYSNAVLTDDTNTSLTSLRLSDIPLQFDADVFAYTVTVPKMSSTMVSAVAEDPKATVSINNTGLSSAEVSLSSGRNVIRVNVIAADGVTTATYEVAVNTPRQLDDDDNDSPSPAYGVNRQTAEDGKVTAVINLYSWSITRLAEAGNETVTLDVSDEEQGDETVEVVLEGSALGKLVERQVGLGIRTSRGELELPLALLETLANSGQPLKISISSSPETVDASNDASSDETVLAAVDIEANYTGETIVRLPAPEGLTEDDLAGVMLKVRHSDGSTEWVRPAIVTDEAGNKYLEISVDHFSTFIMYKAAEPVTLRSVVVIGDIALDLDCLFIKEEMHTVEKLVNNLIIEQDLSLHELWWRSDGGNFSNIGDESQVAEDEILSTIHKYLNPELETIRIYHRD